MGKLGLRKIENTEIVPVPMEPAAPQKSMQPINNPNVLPEIVLKHSEELVSIVKDIVQGKLEIARIEALTDSQVKRIAAETNRILEEANMKIKEMETEGREWGRKFDKKKELLVEVINKIKASPEMDKEERLAVINAVTAVISQP